MAKDFGLTEGEQAEVEAGIDSQISELMGDFDGPDPTDEQAPVAPATEPEKALKEEQPEQLEEDAEDAPESGAAPEVSYTGAEHAKAFLALQRDGWTEEEINDLPKGAMVRRGLERGLGQREVDRKIAEAGRTRNQQSDASNVEPNEEARESVDSAQVEFGDSQSAGADLASLALPAAEAIANMSDPKEIARELGKLLTNPAFRQTAPTDQSTLDVVLADRAERNLKGRYEGDTTALIAKAQRLGEVGEHADKKGLARFDALLDDALKLSGQEVVPQDNSTSRATPERQGSRPPIRGTKPPTRDRTEDDMWADRISAVINGERNVDRINAIR